MTHESFGKKFLESTEEWLADLAELVAIYSVAQPESKGANAPFGLPLRSAFDWLIHKAEAFGLAVRDFDGYALEISYGQSSESLGILTHVDVVELGERALWCTEPLTLTQKDGLLFGRGVADDKSAVIGFLHLFKILQQADILPAKKLKLIVGGAEETSWDCMRYYLKQTPPPDFSFSPDCDFPVVNCEKGILRLTLSTAWTDTQILEICSEEGFNFCLNHVTIRFKDGKMLESKAEKTLSRNPHKAQGVLPARDVQDGLLTELTAHFADPLGKSLGLATCNSSGFLTTALTFVTFRKGTLTLGLDIRYPAGIERAEILAKLSSQLPGYRLEVQEALCKERLYLPAEHPLVRTLAQAYYTVTGQEASPITKGGASYARMMPHCVGFGPTFQGFDSRPHKENECICLADFVRAMEVYYEAVAHL